MESGKREPRPADSVTVAVASAGGLLLLNILAWPVLIHFGASDWPPAARLATSALIAEVGLVVPLVIILQGSRLSWRRALALRRPALLSTALAVVAIVGGGLLLDEVMYLVAHLLPWMGSTSLTTMGQILAEASPAVALVLLLPLAVAPALGEEALCRGAVLRGLERGAGGAPMALLVSSLYFGVLHFDRLHGPIAVLMGLLLGFVALRTGSLWPPVACHLVNNTISILGPALGAPSVVDVMDHGLPLWLVAAGGVTFAGGLAGLVVTTRKTRGSNEKDEDGSDGSDGGEQERSENGSSVDAGHQGPEDQR